MSEHEENHHEKNQHSNSKGSREFRNSAFGNKGSHPHRGYRGQRPHGQSRGGRNQSGNCTHHSKGFDSGQAPQETDWRQRAEESSSGRRGEQNEKYDESNYQQPRQQQRKNYSANRRGNNPKRKEVRMQLDPEDGPTQVVEKSNTENNSLVLTTNDAIPTLAAGSTLNAGAPEYKPAVVVETHPDPDISGRTTEFTSDISMEDDSMNESMLSPTQLNQTVDETTSSLQDTTLDSSSAQESSTSFDSSWNDNHASPNTSGKLQDSKYKTTKNITNISPFQKDVSLNDNMNKKASSFENCERKIRPIITKGEYAIVEEKEADLFAMEPSYALANCVAADMNMGSGIAVNFRQAFGGIDELMAQRQTTGGLAFLNIKGRFIYYLVTKRESSKKPTYDTLFRSLEKLKDHMIENEVKTLAIPRLGCGLDRLEWSRVKAMLEVIFTGTNVKITVCNFQKADESMSEKKERLQSRKCYVERVSEPITKAKPNSIILYLGMANGYIDDNIERLDERFRIKKDYKKSSRELGSIVVTIVENYKYYLVGCIAKKDFNAKIDYQEFKKCLDLIKKENAKFAKNYQNYELVAMGSYYDSDEPQLMSLLENLLKHTLYGVSITIHGN